MQGPPLPSTSSRVWCLDSWPCGMGQDAQANHSLGTGLGLRGNQHCVDL